MRKAGRPQGQLKGETAEANALAQFVRDITSGQSVRELAQRYRLSKTTWSEYRSAQKDIPWHRLELLVRDRTADPRTRSRVLAQARHLHTEAAEAARGLRPPVTEPPSPAEQALHRAQEAQRQAEAGLADASEMMRDLTGIIAELRHQVSMEHTGSAAGRDCGPARSARCIRDACRCLSEVGRASAEARNARREVQREQDIYRHMIAQEGSRDGTPRQEPDAEAAMLPDSTAARLPALRETEAVVVRVRAELAEQGKEVVRLAEALWVTPRKSRLVWTARIIRLARTTDLARVTDPAHTVRGEAVRTPSRFLPRFPPRPKRQRHLALPSGDTGTPPVRLRGLRGGPGVAVALLLVVVGILLGARLGVPQALDWSDGPGTTDSARSPSKTLPSPGTAAPSPAQGTSPLPSPTSHPFRPSASPGPDVARTEGTQDRKFLAPPLSAPASDQSMPPAPSGTLYAIAPDHRSVRQWQGHGMDWIRIGGPADRILAGRAGLFAVDADSKQLLGYLGTPGKWAPVSEPSADFAISGDRLYRISADHNAVERWDGNGTRWTWIGGPAARLYGGGAGIFATHPGDGRIYRYDSATNFWPYVGNAGADFAVTDHHLYGLTPDRSEIFQWNGGSGASWHRIGGPANSLYASPVGVFAASADDGTLLRYTDAPESWAPVGEGGAGFAFTGNHVFRISRDRNGVFQAAAGNTGTWMRIGGPAAALAASW
ncbi:hypothetical protein [Streptomyces melanogenes]|uniref:hypothetical protein n=1 Tax=Streptomyces melanogenes TaxID=67326 RepID=UPI0037A71261